jgi:hypothetical protein
VLLPLVDLVHLLSAILQTGTETRTSSLTHPMNCEIGNTLAINLLSCLHYLTELHQRNHGHHIYFLARDGWLPYRLLQNKLPSSYLAISRLVLRQPLMLKDPLRAARWCIDPVAVNTPRSVLNKLEACPEEVADSLRAVGIGEGDWDSPMGRSARRKLTQLFQTPAFLTLLGRLKENKKPLLLGYLAQSGILSHEAASVFDIGWNGSCQLHLQELRAEAGLAPSSLGGVYVGLQNRRVFAEKTPISVLWESGGRGNELFNHPSFYVLAEMFFTADHGGVIGYESVNNRYQPVLAAHAGEVYENWGLSRFHDDLVNAVPHHLPNCENDFDKLAEQTVRDFLQFASHPSYSDACRFGNWPASVDLSHGNAHPLAPSMNLPEIWNYFVHRLPQPVLWREGVIARMNGPLRLLFQVVNALDRNVDKVRGYVSRLKV